jgi:uncharacterized protein (DUF1330 family)
LSAYIIFTREETLDQTALDTYSKIPDKLQGHPVTVRVGYGEIEVLEGPPIEGVVVLEFPDTDAARNWYHSPAYQAAAQHRFKGARYRGFIVQGM